MTPELEGLADEDYCYLTTTGRISGEPREIEIWFGLAGSTLYMLSGGRDRSNWVRNLMRTPEVRVRIDDREFEGTARIVNDGTEDATVRRLLLDKYGPGYSGDLTEWGRDSLPVAVDLGGRVATPSGAAASSRRRRGRAGWRPS